MRTHKLPFLGASCVLLAFASLACGEDEPVPLFDEQGAWILTKFDLDGKGLGSFDVGYRQDKFMIYFDQPSQVVAAAACLDSMGRTDLTQTLCDTGKFACRCFSYEFMETQMTWTEFAPKGGKLPDPPPKDANVPAPGDPVVFAVESFPESGGTYRYSTLPYGLFNSNGDPSASEFVFQSRNASVFMPTGCIETCGIPAASEAEGG